MNTDRDYFQAQINKDVGLFVGAVVPPKVAGKEIFVAARRRPGKSFAGVTAVAIRPFNTEAFYQAIGSAPGSYYALIRDDGAFLARYPEPAQRGLKLNSESTTMKSIAAQPESGINSLTSQTDTVKRRLGYRKVPHYPVYALAGVDRDVIVGEWVGLMASHLIFGLPATAIMFVALYFGLLRTRRLYREAEARESAEAALVQSQKMESIGQLTGGVAHDFNNLLTVIIGNLDIAKRAFERGVEKSPTRVSLAVDNALQAARRAATLTQRLLAFARKQPLQPEVIDTNGAVREASALLRRVLGENYELQVIYGSGICNVEVDLAQLEVCLVNLVINARDAMEGTGTVTIKTGNIDFDGADSANGLDLKPGQYAVITISDTGKGMPTDVLTRAFEPFFTTKPAGQGTGLGLSQVYGFVKQSGGDAFLSSEVGRGTTVKLYFPRAHGRANSKDGAIQALPMLGRGQRILVVEDDDDLRQFVADTLRDLNYDVTEAANGEQALKTFQSGEKLFDALLTDVIMPGLNGRQLADSVAAISPTTRVLYMTGYSRDAITHHGKLDAGLKLLQKPFSRHELASQIGSLFA